MKIYNESLFSQLHLTILLTTVLFAVSTETFDQNTEKKKGPKHILTGHLCYNMFLLQIAHVHELCGDEFTQQIHTICCSVCV